MTIKQLLTAGWVFTDVFELALPYKSSSCLSSLLLTTKFLYQKRVYLNRTRKWTQQSQNKNYMKKKCLQWTLWTLEPDNNSYKRRFKEQMVKLKNKFKIIKKAKRKQKQRGDPTNSRINHKQPSPPTPKYASSSWSRRPSQLRAQICSHQFPTMLVLAQAKKSSTTTRMWPTPQRHQRRKPEKDCPARVITSHIGAPQEKLSAHLNKLLQPITRQGQQL